MKRRVLLLVIVGLALVGSSARQQEPPPGLARITLSGFMYTPDGGSLAIINGLTVKEGQEVLGFVVKSITRDYVILTADGRDYRVEPTGTSTTPMDLGVAQSLRVSRQFDAYSQSVTQKEEDYKADKKKECLALALSHERQAHNLSDFQQALYHIQEAMVNYRNALSLESDRLERVEIELKIQRLEDQVRVVNNRMNQPARATESFPLRRY